MPAERPTPQHYLTFLLGILGPPSPCPELPLRPGTAWMYRADVAWTPAGAATAHDTALVWTTTVLSVRTTDSTQVATVHNWPTALAWWEPGKAPKTSLLVCHSGGVYLFDLDDAASPALVDSLLTGRKQLRLDNLIFLFPLHAGDLFGREPATRRDTFYAWFVESVASAGTELVRFGATSRDSVYTLVYRTLADHQLVAFSPKLGMTRYVYGHHGTVASVNAVLIGYQPASPSR